MKSKDTLRHELEGCTGFAVARPILEVLLDIRWELQMIRSQLPVEEVVKDGV